MVGARSWRRHTGRAKARKGCILSQWMAAATQRYTVSSSVFEEPKKPSANSMHSLKELKKGVAGGARLFSSSAAGRNETREKLKIGPDCSAPLAPSKYLMDRAPVQSHTPDLPLSVAQVTLPPLSRWQAALSPSLKRAAINLARLGTLPLLALHFP